MTDLEKSAERIVRRLLGESYNDQLDQKHCEAILPILQEISPEKPKREPRTIKHDAIHVWFELSYANYLVIPRSVLQQMPDRWQTQFVKLLDELDETFEWRRNGCFVRFEYRDKTPMHDELNDYRHTNFTAEEIKEITQRHNERYDKVPAPAWGEE